MGGANTVSFRVLIAGGRHFHSYATLRAALDALLVNRLPDVELLIPSQKSGPTPKGAGDEKMP